MSRLGWIILRWFVVCIVVASMGMIIVNGQMTMTDWLERRVTTIEAQNLYGRVLVLESDMIELKWLSRMATAALVGQFGSMVIRAINKRRQEDEA